jgi:hypothetical protein
MTRAGDDAERLHAMQSGSARCGQSGSGAHD